MHWLPIERNRYCREKLDRIKRICTKTLGNALIECNRDSLREIRNTYATKVGNISREFSNLAATDQFIYLLKGDNITILPTVCEWLMKINDVYKGKGY